MKNEKRISTYTLTLGAILTAIVVVLQLVSKISAAFLPISITLTLIPVVIGSVKCHPAMGGWLGFVSGVVILISGAGEPFFTFNPFATIVVVLVKGAVSGLVAGLVYRLLKSRPTVAVFAAAAAAPIVNTGIFFIGCLLFFMELVTEWAGSGSVALYMFTGLAGINFLVEFALNIVLAPTVKRLLEIRDK